MPHGGQRHGTRRKKWGTWKFDEANIKMKNSTKHRSHADGGKCGGQLIVQLIDVIIYNK